MASKSKAQRSHFKRRIAERYQLTLDPNDYDMLISRIQKNHETVKFLERQSNRVSIIEIDFRGKKIICVYDKLRGTLVSALPYPYNQLDMLDEGF